MTLKKTHKALLTALVILAVVVGVAAVSINIYLVVNKPRYQNNEEFYGPLYGKDYTGHVGDGRFRFSKYNYVEDLSVNFTKISKSGETYFTSENVLACIYDRTSDYYGNCYCYAADGYAVIYASNNMCKVFITDPPADFATGNGKKLFGRYPENNYRIEKLEGKEFEGIVYLNSFDEFAEKEQKMLKRLKKPKGN